MNRLWFVLLWAMPLAAMASSAYPDEIDRVLVACKPPQCTVCHSTTRGGAGTATKPFAITMQNAGLTGGTNLAALRAALQAVETNGTDTDGDGVADIAELEQGSDPSNPLSTTTSCGADGGTRGPGRGRRDGGGAIPDGELTSQNAEPPMYGCSAAPGGIGAIVLLLVFGARRRSHHPRSR